MFEDKSEILRGHIAFLEELLSDDECKDNDIAEIELRLECCQKDIDEARSNLPYDEIDDEVAIEDFTGDNLEDGELEDEIVEVEAVINELEDLMEQARDFLSECNEGETSTVNEGQPLLAETMDIKECLETWLVKEIAAVCERRGISRSDKDIIRTAKAIILGAECRGDFAKAEEMGKTECPEYGFTADELKQADLFSPGLFHITMEMLQLGAVSYFEQMISFKKSIWL